MTRKKSFIFILCAILICFLAVLPILFIINNSSDNNKYQDKYSYAYPNSSKVGYSAKYLGTVARQTPEISNEGLEKYPVYGTNLTATDEEKQAILNENSYLNASSSTYDSMDSDGNLYLNGTLLDRKLYKHTASIGMYEGNVSDDEPAIIKEITIKSRSAGNHITGLYAPAGEVIKIEMSEEDFEKTGGLVVYIGQALTNGQANNIWLARIFNRMPVIVNTMTTKSSVDYVGSFLGGPIYIKPVKSGTTFSVKITGGVSYSHFILGYTSQEEFEMNKDSSAPYFDLEVWDDGVRHSGPKNRAKQFDYDQLYKAAVLWDKIALVSNQVPSGSPGNIGITFLYDPFVAAGSMVAFVGRYTVNCPTYCLTAALDYESAVNNAPDAFWGCIHEFNHHYQRYGFAPGDETTNNAISLVSYSLFTKISSNRNLDNNNEGNYAVSWNRYTNPSWTLKQTLANTKANSALDSYANILHNFGQEIFINATKNGNGSGGVDVWYKALNDATHHDMSYYFEEILHQTISSSVKKSYKEKNYPMFVPISTIYQTGRSFYFDGEKKYISTVQPYEIDFDKNFIIDLKNNLVIPDGFSYTITNITKPEHGSVIDNGDNTYTYLPDKNYSESGKIIVSISINKNDGAFNVDDVDIVIELKQKQKSNILERTIYTYNDDTMYQDINDAFINNYAGYNSVLTEDNINNVQNSNSEIWEPNPTSNAIMEVKGKIYISETGKYRIALRGRKYANLYISLDNNNFDLAATVENLNESPNFDLSNPSTYKDIELEKGQWLYFKAVLLVTYSRSYIGVGWGQFNGDTVNVSYLNAYRNSYIPQEFTSDYFYTRNYTYNYSNTPQVEQTLVSTNYQPWDKNYPIDALFDDNKNNYIHSNKNNINENNPFEITVDLGKEINANTLTIYGEPTKKYLPSTFKLYVGNTLEQLTLIKDVQNVSSNGSNVIANFDETNFRYYKLIVTDTSATGIKYIAYRYAEFSYSITNGKMISPDDSMFTYNGNWEIQSSLANFGHIYIGENASLTFEFTGTRFGIISQNFDNFDNFEIIIDGHKLSNINFKNSNDKHELIFISNLLENKKHTIIIQSSNKFNIDSIILW